MTAEEWIPGMVEVTQRDANNYCRVLTALGMEEEGDPVAEIERLRAKNARLTAEVERLRAALLDANQTCRSAWAISNRIATEYSTNEMGTYFGAFSERTHESLKRQHDVILATGGYPKPDGA